MFTHTHTHVAMDKKSQFSRTVVRALDFQTVVKIMATTMNITESRIFIGKMN